MGKAASRTGKAVVSTQSRVMVAESVRDNGMLPRLRRL